MAEDRVQRQVDRLLDEAEAAITNEDWPTVGGRARSVLAIDPVNSDAMTYLAAAERAVGGSTPPATLDPTTPTPPPTTSVEHASFDDGRYQVKQFLGEGGKKKVYLAHDTTLDREVAFALIKAEGLDDVSRTRFQREAQAMGRLGTHPHIVTVFDLGEEQDQPYIVTEFMGGGDVEGLLEQGDSHQLPLDRAIKIAKETCRGLDFAHRRGIIHRDLKPGNVWLTEDGTAKIGDFGLALSLDRPRLTTEGMMVGTVAYMPPEQAMGGEVTPRSDLYSLGAMLYEMVCGRPPFLGDDSVAIIGQHINTPAVAPTWHNAQCPRPLEALILRLLAKDPSERPNSATDVLTALEAIDLVENAEIPGADGSMSRNTNVLDGLARDVFVGRQREMGELKSYLEEVLSGRGRMVAVVGEPGIGKSRTAQELATYARLRGFQVLWGRCYEEQGVPPYWPWIQAIRAYVRDCEPSELTSVMGAGAADIAEVVSDVREKLPGLPKPVQMDSPEAERFRQFDSIAVFLRSASQRQPLMVVIDDLQWSDETSLVLLQFVVRELGESRVLLVGTYRGVELNRRHRLAEILGDLTKESSFKRVVLRGLSHGDVGRFIEIVSGTKPPEGLVAAVYARTEGNPLFVSEVVRLLVQEGDLTREGVGVRESWTVRIPEGIREVIGRRLDRLSSQCNEVLSVAAVVGREFELRQLDQIIEDLNHDMLLEALEEALAAQVLEELPASVNRYQFTNALMQETLVRELSLSRRVRLHARIAEALEKLYGSQSESHAAELAFHFDEAQDILGTDKLVTYSLIRGKQALATNAYEEASTQFQRAATGKGDSEPDAEMATIKFGLGRSLLALSKIDEGLANLRSAFDFYVANGQIPSAIEIAEHPLPFLAGLLEGAPELIEDALALAPTDSHEAGRLFSRYGSTLYFQTGDYVKAQEAFDKAIAIARRENDLTLVMRTLADAAFVDVYQCEWETCKQKSLQAIEIAKRYDDPMSEVVAHYGATLALTVSGDSKDAAVHAYAALGPAEKWRHRSWQSRAYAASGFLYGLKGDWNKFREYNDQGIAIAPHDGRHLAPRAIHETQVGESTKGTAYLELLLAATRLSPPGPTFEHAIQALVIPIIGRINGSPRYFDIASSEAEIVLSSRNITPLMELWARAGLALMAYQRGDSVTAEAQYANLAPLSGGVQFVISGDRILGLTASAAGNLDAAVEHMEAAMTLCRKAEYQPELAWCIADLTEILFTRDQPGDQQRAFTLQTQALQIAGEFGLIPLTEQIVSRRNFLMA